MIPTSASPARPPPQPSPLRFSSTPSHDTPVPTTSTTTKRSFDIAGLVDNGPQSEHQQHLPPLRAAIMQPLPLSTTPTIRVPTPSPEPELEPPKAAASAAAPPAKRPRTKKVAARDDDYDDGEEAGASSAVMTSRVCGTTILPTARVSKIMKADKDMSTTAKEAVFLISVATEEFIKKLAQEGYQQARKEGRTTVQQKDLAAATKRVDELSFLSEIIPFPIKAKDAVEKRNTKQQAAAAEAAETDVTAGPLGKAFQKSKGAAGGLTVIKGGKGKAKAAATAPAAPNGRANGVAAPPDADSEAASHSVAALSNDVGRAVLTDSEMDVS